MKYIKRFNEAIIRPYDFDGVIDKIRKSRNLTIDKINTMFKKLNVEFIDVEYFTSTLKTQKEIELVPIDMKEIMGGVRFGAHNIYTNKMYVCINEPVFLREINAGFKEPLLGLLREILRHESIHKQQGEKRDVVIRNLENSPKKPKEYFSSTDEVMAYAQSFIDQCKQRRMEDDEILSVLKSGRKVSWVQDVYSNLVDDESRRRFNKYVYQYLKEDK